MSLVIERNFLIVYSTILGKKIIIPKINLFFQRQYKKFL
jgi:hypothetical protein